MKLLFCYDGPLRKSSEGAYYGSALNNDLFSRYEIIADEINIAIRVKRLDSNNMLRLSEKYHVFELPDVKSIRGIRNIGRLKRKIDTLVQKHDIVVVRLPSTIGDYAIESCKKFNKRYIVELVGCAWDAYWNHGLIGKIVAPISYWKTKKGVRESDSVLYVSDRFLQKRYPTNAFTTNCSNVVINTIDINNLRKRIERINRLEKKELRIGTIGKFSLRTKGQEYVIKALKRLKREGYHIKYELVGGGDSARLRRIAEKNGVSDMVSFIGHLKHDDVFSWIDSIDIYIQPSLQEGLCRSIIESMSRACPVIASNAGGNAELINNEYIFKKKNVKQIASLIRKMTRNEMMKEAKVNFENSKKYNSNILKARRDDFYSKASQER